MHPIKILDNFYVLGVIHKDNHQKYEFLDFDEVEKIEFLVSQKPIAHRFFIEEREYYTPCLGNFIISSPNEYFIKKKDKEIIEDLAEKFYFKLKLTHDKMNLCFFELEEAVYSRHSRRII